MCVNRQADKYEAPPTITFILVSTSLSEGNLRLGIIVFNSNGFILALRISNIGLPVTIPPKNQLVLDLDLTLLLSEAPPIQLLQMELLSTEVNKHMCS